MDRNWYEKKLLAKQLHTYYSVLQEGLSVPLAPWLRRAAESEMFVWNMNNPNHVDLEKLWYTKTNY